MLLGQFRFALGFVGLLLYVKDTVHLYSLFHLKGQNIEL
jgi:hypothetical protein